MIAAGFSVFSACLLGCFVGLSASQDVYCLKNNSRLKASNSSEIQTCPHVYKLTIPVHETTCSLTSEVFCCR